MVMHAYNPGICEVGAGDLKPTASLGYIERGEAKGNVTTWQQGWRLGLGTYMPRSTEDGGHEELGERPEVDPSEGTY